LTESLSAGPSYQDESSGSVTGCLADEPIDHDRLQVADVGVSDCLGYPDIADSE